MLGLIDRIYTYFRIRNKPEKIEVIPKIIKGSDNKEVSFYFVPSVVSSSHLGNGIIRMGENSIIHTIPSRELVHEDPAETVNNLQRIYNPAADLMQEYISQGYRINLIGVSLGNVLTIRAASEVVKWQLNKLVSIAGGYRLGNSAWQSILTRDIVRKNCSSAEVYEEGVKAFSPATYVSRIKAEELYFRIGTHDLLIPSSEGRALMGALRNKVFKTDIKCYLGASHGTSIYLASRDLREKNKV